jgi:hypothetical protein
MKCTLPGLVLGALLGAGGAMAQPVVVEAVQSPAWLERGGYAVPLTPGTMLQPSDRLRTGGNARVQLKLAEGSAVKLGENAQVVVERAQAGGVFKATLQVLAGAFRFTTSKLLGRERDVSIKVGLVTAGIRGTDLWGKSSEARDLVCLLEGRIAVESEGHPAVALEQPLEFYQRPRGGEPGVGKVDAKQVEEWARETELAPDGPTARAGGRWRVAAAKYETRDRALATRRDLRARGYPAEVAGPHNGIYSVNVSGLAGEAEARALMANLRQVPGITLPAIAEGSPVSR